MAIDLTMADESDLDEQEYYVDILDGPQEKTLVELDSEEREETKKKKKASSTFDFPGVCKLPLDVSTQQSLGIEVGVDITVEEPWKTVKKEAIFDNMAVQQGNSSFYDFNSDLELYEEEDVLMGYIFKETGDVDEYYICLNLEAKQHCETLFKRLHKKQTKKLEALIYKTPKQWLSLGSEHEIDEFNVETSRQLIKIEVKINFPRRQPKFSQKTEGYVELIPTRDQFQNVYRKRSHSEVQAVPVETSREVQTDPKFPRNFWTQCDVEKDISVESNANLDLVAFNRAAESMLDVVRFNSILDIYNIDYPRLIGNHDLFNACESLNFEEVLFFKDPRSNGKSVSSVAWNPAQPDILAVAYADSVIGSMLDDLEPADQVKRDVFGSNPVMIWNTSDSLSPLLYLESEREVRVLSFRSTDVLIGGCINGCIVAWNLKGVQQRAPEQPSETQRRFKTITNKALDYKAVRPWFKSDLMSSHANQITQFVWVPSNYQVDNLGRVQNLDGESGQFFSVSFDGSVMIWDLELRSLYKMYLEDKIKAPLTAMLFKGVEQPIKPAKIPKNIAWLTSLYGDVFKVSWTGEEVEVEKSAKCECFEVLLKIKLHDGGVTCCTRSPFFGDVFATLGGKIFAVWSCENLEPLMWKKTKYKLTSFTWSPWVASQVYVSREDGSVDVWDFLHCSDVPSESRMVSGDALLGMYPVGDYIAAADLWGSLRLLRPSTALVASNDLKVKRAEDFFGEELQAKKVFRDWEERWFEKHLEEIERKKKNELAAQKERERKLKVLAIKEQERREIEAEKKKEERPIIPSAEEKWKNMQWRHASRLIQEMKRLSKVNLEKKEKPLRDLEAHSLEVSSKQCQMLKKQESIFDETIAVLFPDALPDTPAPLPIVRQDELNEKRRNIRLEFDNITTESRDFIRDNPFTFDFKWENCLMSGKSRRSVLDSVFAKFGLVVEIRDKVLDT